jgi:hypothetical protein
MTRKKMVVGGLVLLMVIVLGGVGFVVANGPWCSSGMDFHSRFHGRAFFHGQQGDHIPEFVLSRMDEHVSFLNLTETQKETYDGIRERIKVRLSEGIADRKLLREDVRREMTREDPDITMIAGLFQERINRLSGFLEEGLNDFVAFYSVLNEDQKRQVIERFRKRFGET